MLYLGPFLEREEKWHMNKYLICLLLVFSACASPSKQRLKVAATPVPHAEMLEFITPDLKAQGIDLKVIVTEDYNIPNRALAQGEVDANFFQHIPFMEMQIKEFHYPIKSMGKIEIEPMGIYSKRIQSLGELQDGSVIALPNDPSNEARALLLLQEEGVIQMKDPDDLQATIVDIQENPKRIRFIEIDAAMLPRSLEDVDAAVINTNYALEAHLSPEKDALALENKDSPYANILAIRTEDENRDDLQALKKAMTSEKMKEFIEKKYRGAVLPSF